MKIVLAGSEGFIGSNIRKMWKTDNILRLDQRNTAHIVRDLTKPESWNFDVEHADVLICLASEANVWGLPSLYPIEHEANILEGAYKFCVRNKIKTLVHISSSNVYGARLTPFKETMFLRPLSRYGVQKMMAEATLNKMDRGQVTGSGPNIISIRMFNAIGDFQRKSMFPYLVVDAARTGSTLPLYGHGAMARAWTPVSDLVNFIRTVAEHEFKTKGYHVFNYGNQKTWTQDRLLLEFAKHNIGVKTHTEEARIGELPYTSACMSRTIAVFGKKVLPSDDLTQSITDVIDYVSQVSHQS